MELIKPTDPQYFELTSEGEYDRHHYKVISKNGDSVVVMDWESARSIWFNKSPFLSHIEVLDVKKKPNTKGFKK